LVSIVASKLAAEAIFDRIARMLSMARTSEFAADLVSSVPLNSGVLGEVGRATNTVARLDPSGKKVRTRAAGPQTFAEPRLTDMVSQIVVTWIHMANRDENFENAGESVLRLLRDVYGPQPRVSAALGRVPGDLAESGRYFPILHYSQKLPWQERADKWERWTSAIGQKGNNSVEQDALVPANILPFAIGPGEPVQLPEISLSGPLPGWSQELHVDTRAIFGHVVFARQQQTLSTSTAQLDTSLPRTFVPIIPALGSLNLPSNLREEGLWHSTTVIRFEPSPDTPPEIIASAPRLELRIEADHQELKGLISLRAIQDAFAGDVLFPEAAVDTRLVQQRYFTLPGASIEQHMPSILTFLSKSSLLPWEGKIATPHLLPGVSLPQRLFSPATNPAADNDHTTSTTNDQTPPTTDDAPSPSPGDDPVQIDYALASAEIHRTITAEYANLKLRYTNILGGQKGGDRSEVSLDAVRVESGDAPSMTDYGYATQAGDPDAHSWSHSMNRRTPEEKEADRALAAAHPPRPVELDEFLLAASGIVTQRGHIKWHAKRS
jgi:hypothetical protein